MLFTIETEKNDKISLLDVNVICEQSKFITSAVYTPILKAFYLIPAKLA